MNERWSDGRVKERVGFEFPLESDAKQEKTSKIEGFLFRLQIPGL